MRISYYSLELWGIRNSKRDVSGVYLVKNKETKTQNLYILQRPLTSEVSSLHLTSNALSAPGPVRTQI